MAQSLTNGFSEKQLALYTDEYYERADLVFRFGALLTVSREGAERLTEETFRMLLQDFSQVKPDALAPKILVNLAWKAWNKMKSEKFHEWNAPILQSMKGLGVEQRVTLYVIEMAGFDISEAARLLGSDDVTIRRMLSEAQKYLATATIRI